MLVYHGSTQIVETPRAVFSRKRVDFGTGFYVTSNHDQALRWAKIKKERTGAPCCYVNVYELPDDLRSRGLSIRSFLGPNSSWLDFVVRCRRADKSHHYDVVKGPVADDNVYETIMLYESGALTKQEAIRRLKVRRLFDQILLHTEKAVKLLRFIEAGPVRSV